MIASMKIRDKKFISKVRSVVDEIGGREMNYAYNISLKHNYLYVENAKCACTTVKTVLGKAEFDGALLGNVTPQWYLDYVHVNVLGTPFVEPFQLTEQQFAEILGGPVFGFAFVRNPYTRLLSGFLDKVRRGNPESQEIVEALGGGKRPEDISFEEFISAIESLSQSHRILDKHWRPQSQQMCVSVIDYDFIGKIELLDADFRRLKIHLGIDLPYDGAVSGRHSTGSKNKIESYYDQKNQERVYRLYEQDFEIFKYKKQLP